jgi:hypothetical protein
VKPRPRGAAQPWVYAASLQRDHGARARIGEWDFAPTSAKIPCKDGTPVPPSRYLQIFLVSVTRCSKTTYGIPPPQSRHRWFVSSPPVPIINRRANCVSASGLTPQPFRHSLPRSLTIESPGERHPAPFPERSDPPAARSAVARRPLMPPTSGCDKTTRDPDTTGQNRTTPKPSPPGDLPQKQ